MGVSDYLGMEVAPQCRNDNRWPYRFEYFKYVVFLNIEIEKMPIGLKNRVWRSISAKRPEIGAKLLIECLAQKAAGTEYQYFMFAAPLFHQSITTALADRYFL